MNVSKDNLNSFFKSYQKVQNVVDQLDLLSDAFFQTGNEIVSDKLERIACVIQENLKIMYESYNKETHDLYMESQKTSYKIMEAALAGCLIGSDTQKGETGCLKKNKE